MYGTRAIDVHLKEISSYKLRTNIAININTKNCELVSQIC